MSTFTDSYANLPGFSVEYTDNNLSIGARSVGATTKSVLLIGTAIDGPIGEPLSVNDLGGVRAAERVFGGLTEVQVRELNGVNVEVKVPHEGSLIRAMHEAINSGCDDIRLVRITGKRARTEIPAALSGGTVKQLLADVYGNSTMTGNAESTQTLTLDAGKFFKGVESIAEFEGADTTVAPLQTVTAINTVAEVNLAAKRVKVLANKFRPGNTLQVGYKVEERAFTEVSFQEDGATIVTSTAGLLQQDPTNASYYMVDTTSPASGKPWSEDITDVANYAVYVGGDNIVSSAMMPDGSMKRLWRVGKEDASVVEDSLSANGAQTSLEFSQGGIRFTQAYHDLVAAGLQPALTGVPVRASYKYYLASESTEIVEVALVGPDKLGLLNGSPKTGEAVRVYYAATGGTIVDLVEGTDFEVIPADPIAGTTVAQIKVFAGHAPVGVTLTAEYKTSGAGGTGSGNEDVKLIIHAASAGKQYSYFRKEGDEDTIDGVFFTIEEDLDNEGHRILNFYKPQSKKLAATDEVIVIKTAELIGVSTLRELANYVNGLVGNNIVALEASGLSAQASIGSLTPTQRTSAGYERIPLGYKYDADLGVFSLYKVEDPTGQAPTEYPWMGNNGFYNLASLEDTSTLYEVLGGRFELDEFSLTKEYVQVDEGIYSILENYAVDQIVMLGAYANTAIGKLNEVGEWEVAKDRNFATQLAQHCAMVTARTWETLGFIGMVPSPGQTLKEVQQYVNLVTNNIRLTDELREEYVSKGINPDYVNQHFIYNVVDHKNVFDDNNALIDIGWYISVVFGPELGMANEVYGNYVSSGVSVYAAIASTLAPESSTTNKELPVTGMRYRLSEAQHNQLAGKAYVSFESKTLNVTSGRSFTIKSGVTAGLLTSDYTRLSTVRITHATVQQIRKAADKYIGLPNSLAQRNSLATEIQSTLDLMKSTGVLQNFRFEIYSSVQDQVLGNAFITLELVPAFELRKIFTTVTLRPSL